MRILGDVYRFIETIKNKIVTSIDEFRENIDLPDDYTILIIRL